VLPSGLDRQQGLPGKPTVPWLIRTRGLDILLSLVPDTLAGDLNAPISQLGQVLLT
jgi:hypothetical protein